MLLSFGSAIMAPGGLPEGAGHVAQRRAAGRAARSATSRPPSSTWFRFKGDIHKELPKTDPGYYFRPQKTILVRTVADGGESFYFCGDHRATMPALWRTLTSAEPQHPTLTALLDEDHNPLIGELGIVGNRQTGIEGLVTRDFAHPVQRLHHRDVGQTSSGVLASGTAEGSGSYTTATKTSAAAGRRRTR